MYTHGDGGGFWSVAKKGAEQAAKDLGVDLDYQESNNDPEAQAQFIEAGVAPAVTASPSRLPTRTPSRARWTRPTTRASRW